MSTFWSWSCDIPGLARLEALVPTVGMGFHAQTPILSCVESYRFRVLWLLNLARIGVPGEEEAPLITPVNGECLLLLVPTKAKSTPW